MHEIIIGHLPHKDAVSLGIRWLNPRTSLLDRAAVEIKTFSDPAKLVTALRELADEIERQLNPLH